MICARAPRSARVLLRGKEIAGCGASLGAMSAMSAMSEMSDSLSPITVAAPVSTLTFTPCGGAVPSAAKKRSVFSAFKKK